MSAEFSKDDCYNGIHGLKKAGIQLGLTARQAEEMYKCKNDVQYFVNNYCKIISLDHGLVNFKTYSYQNRMLEKIENNRFSIFLWPRQMGKSTTVAAMLLHCIVFNQEYKIAILAQKADQAREILGRLQLMYQELPWWMQPGVITWNKGNIILGNRSEAFTSATKGSGVRGKSINMLYLDEFAHVDNDVEFYESSYPVVTSGTTTKIVITSTPNGMNLFYNLCTKAERGENEYVFDRALWSEHPKRDQKWYEEQMRNMTERQFEQEFECVGYESRVTLREGETTFNLPIGDVWTLLPSVDNSDCKYVKDVSLLRAMKSTPGVVYKLTRLKDGLSYIGITTDLSKRLDSHRNSARFKDSDFTHSVLFEGSYLECAELEERYIEEHDTWKNGLNLTKSGKGKSHTGNFNTLGHVYSEKEPV